MLLHLEIALVATGAYIIYLVVVHLVSSHRNAAKARELGCKEPPIQRNRYPLGIDNLLRAIAADKARIFPLDMIQRTVDVGAITYKYTLLGSTNFFTADEKNIQTMLATNFNDWDVSSKMVLPPIFEILIVLNSTGTVRSKPYRELQTIVGIGDLHSRWTGLGTF